MGCVYSIEIDERRYKEALENFKQAGLSAYIDSRMAGAHELVPQLEGPFDLVFIDADKGWYVNYAKAVILKLDLADVLLFIMFGRLPGAAGGEEAAEQADIMNS